MGRSRVFDMSVPFPLHAVFEQLARDNDLASVQEYLLSCGWHAAIFNRPHTITADFVRAKPKEQDQYIAGLDQHRREKAEHATLMERCITEGCADYLRERCGVETLSPDDIEDIRRRIAAALKLKLREAARSAASTNGREDPHVIALALELARSGANESARHWRSRDATRREVDEYLSAHWDELIPRARALIHT